MSVAGMGTMVFSPQLAATAAKKSTVKNSGMFTNDRPMSLITLLIDGNGKCVRRHYYTLFPAMGSSGLKNEGLRKADDERADFGQKKTRQFYAL